MLKSILSATQLLREAFFSLTVRVLTALSSRISANDLGVLARARFSFEDNQVNPSFSAHHENILLDVSPNLLMFDWPRAVCFHHS